MSKIKIGLKKPLEGIKFIEIENDYETIRDLVGGDFECVSLEDYTLYIDENGSCKCLPINLNIVANTIVGNALVTRIDELTGEEISLTSDDEERITKLLSDYILYKPGNDVTEVLKNMNLGLITFLFKNMIEGKIKDSINNFYELEDTLELLSYKHINSDIDKRFVLSDVMCETLGSDIYLDTLEKKYDIDVLYYQLVTTWEMIKLRTSVQIR